MDKHGETQVPGRLTGRGMLVLEACAWANGNIELRINDHSKPWLWVNLEVNLGDLMQWYRAQRIEQEKPVVDMNEAAYHPTDKPPDELGAR